jgi:hypothetical protein
VPIVVGLRSGSLAVELLPTDAEGISPTSWSYLMTEQIHGPENKWSGY